MLSVYGGMRAWSEYSRAAGIATFEHNRTLELARIISPSVNDPDTSLWSPARIAHYRQSANSVGEPSAVLRIPAVSLAVAVFEGTSEPVLNRGAGRVEGTARIGDQGNIGLAAHRDGFFRNLKDIRLGDELQLEDKNGSLDIYRVVSTRIVEPTEVSVLDDDGTPALTLVTCYPFYFVGSAPKRFVVRAERIDARIGLQATARAEEAPNRS